MNLARGDHGRPALRRSAWLIATTLLACDTSAGGDAVDPPGSVPDDTPTHAAAARASAEDGPMAGEALHLRPPPMRAPSDIATYDAIPPSPGARIAQAFQFDAPVFRYPNEARRIAGLVRRNTRLAVDRWVPGAGCTKSWYALLGGGYVCTADGFNVAADPARLSEALQVDPPAVDEGLPYRYAKLKTPAPLYWRLPTEIELSSGSSAPIREQAQGAHFVAMDRSMAVGDITFHRTVRGYFIREQDLEPKPLPTMHGELLSGSAALPLAFVHVEEATLLDPATGSTRGKAERFARFAVSEIHDVDGQRMVVAQEGFEVAADEVRVAQLRARPDEVAATDKWIHVDLDQQLLVAYEGDKPVLATLVSSGKEGFAPPLGLFRVHKKYTTVTMAGPDPDAGTYAVEQVPWTMYYWGSFALHGAYWHDTFGNVRSHGCTNIPPIDARWLFYWSDPELHTGWHAQVGLDKGPWVHFSHGTTEGEGDPEPPTRSAAP